MIRHTPQYSNQYRLEIASEFSGMDVVGFFSERFSFKPRAYWQELIEKGQVTVNGQGVDPSDFLSEGDIVHTVRHDIIEPDVRIDYTVLCDEKGLFIINKPAPIPVHPSGRYFKNSLLTVLREDYPDKKFHTIHRLDTWTTGVLLLATNPEVARVLHLHVEKSEMKKSYAVMARGDFGSEDFIIDEAVGRVDGAHRGFGENITDAKDSITEFRPIASRDGVTLLRAIPITGRTNQIRVHIQAAGGEVLNDPLYSSEQKENQKYIGLHCVQMGFLIDEEEMFFIAPFPEHFTKYFKNEELNQCKIK